MRCLLRTFGVSPKLSELIVSAMAASCAFRRAVSAAASSSVYSFSSGAGGEGVATGAASCAARVHPLSSAPRYCGCRSATRGNAARGPRRTRLLTGRWGRGRGGALGAGGRGRGRRCRSGRRSRRLRVSHAASSRKSAPEGRLNRARPSLSYDTGQSRWGSRGRPACESACARWRSAWAAQSSARRASQSIASCRVARRRHLNRR
jgi:hypothetical protein